jgi:VWFA-related protein
MGVLSSLLLAGGFASLASQEAPPPGGTLRVEVQVVNVYCTVKNKKGGLVTDLEASDFEIREDGKRQEIRYFDRETDRPLTLGLLFDTSGSQERILPEEKQVATQFLRQVLRPTDLALLITFDVGVDLLQDFTSEPEPLERALARARINAPGTSVNPGPFPRRVVGTALYDAVYLAARAKLAPEVGRKAIILVSDGEDFGSKVSLEQALEATHLSDTIIYAIGVADPERYLQGLGRPYQGKGILEKLAKESGGRAIFLSDPEELQEAFDQLASELRSQYYLGYTPTNRTRDGRFRKLEVRVKTKGLRVQARRGYYAPKS